VLPAWSNEVIAMLKNTAVVYVIAILDLMGQAKNAEQQLLFPDPHLHDAAVFYLVLVGITYCCCARSNAGRKSPG
jgi:polar amino acid transport system permease protein